MKKFTIESSDLEKNLLEFKYIFTCLYFAANGLKNVNREGISI